MSLAALTAVWVVIRVAASPAPATVEVVVATRDLPAGHQLRPDDLRTVSWPNDLAPAARAGAAVAGDVLAAPLGRGEPLTATRILGPGLLQGLPAGTVAIPLRPTDPAAAALVRPGDHVDVLTSAPVGWAAAADESAFDAAPIATGRAVRNALVLSAVPTTAADASSSDSFLSGSQATGDATAASLPGIVVLAVAATEVTRLNQAITGAQVTVVVLP